ncbi:MAG: hypothetical protein LRY20_00680 [Acholeplasmataceae bacterium]|nr:hypothetical protein [Acholeplasmataceae bacterium]
MKKSIIFFILVFTFFFINGCQKEELLDITIHTFRYTMEGVSYVDKVKPTPDDITENTFDLIFASNMLDRIQTEVYLNTYEDYRALHHSNDTPVYI